MTIDHKIVGTAFAVLAGTMLTGLPAWGGEAAPSVTAWEAAVPLDRAEDAGTDGRAPSRRSRRVFGAIEIKPLSLLVSPDMDGFRVTSEGRGWRRTEEIEGVGSLVPTLRLGLRVDVGAVASFLTVGGGALANAAYVAPLGMLEASVRVKLGRHVLVGPRLGAVFVGDAEWLGDADVSLSSTRGGFLGVGVSVGSPAVAFSIALNYVHMRPVDVTTGGGWRPSADRVDYSGPMVSMGVLFRL